MNPGEVPCRLKKDLDPGKFDLIGGQGNGVPKEFIHRQRFQFRAALPGKVQKVADDLLGSAGLMNHIFNHIFSFLLAQLIIILEKHVGREGDVIQGLVEFVGHSGG